MSKMGLFNSIRRKAFERGEEARRLLQQYGILDDNQMNDVIGRLQDATTKLSENPRMTRLTHDASLNHFLTDDQRFKNQFERRSSSGTYNPDTRDAFENKMFGTHPKANPDEGAIYGLVDSDNAINAAVKDGYAYGGNQVRLKPETRYRATFTLGDSLGDEASTTPTPFSEPNVSVLVNPEELEYRMGIDNFAKQMRQDKLLKGITEDKMRGIQLTDEAKWHKDYWKEANELAYRDLEGEALNNTLEREWETKIQEERSRIYAKLKELEKQKLGKSNGPYIENQIFGGVTPADVESIYTPNKTELPKSWKETADKYGIRFEGPDGCYYNCND